MMRLADTTPDGMSRMRVKKDAADGLRERERIAARFAAATPTYDAHADVQRRVARRIAALTAALIPLPRRIAEVGCGTGLLTRELRARFPQAHIDASDLSAAMVAHARADLHDDAIAWRVADAETMEFPPDTELITSSLCAQWFMEFEVTLRRHLTFAPRIAFATLLEGTFVEWARACRAHGVATGLREFLPASTLMPLVRAAGATRVRVIRERVRGTYPDALMFLRALRGIGATTPRDGHRPAQLRPVLRAHVHGFTASYDVAYVIAEGPCASS